MLNESKFPILRMELPPSNGLDGLLLKARLLEDLQSIGLGDVREAIVTEDHLHRDDRCILVTELHNLLGNRLRNLGVQANRQCARSHDIDGVIAKLSFFNGERQWQIALQQHLVKQVLPCAVNQDVLHRIAQEQLDLVRFGIPRNDVAGVQLEDLEAKILILCGQ